MEISNKKGVEESRRKTFPHCGSETVDLHQIPPRRTLRYFVAALIKAATIEGGEIKMRRRIRSQALILVCDGRKALFLRNKGDDIFPNLQVTEVIRGKANPRTSAQGADRPGRVLDRATGRHGAIEQTDWHTLEEEHFAREIAAALSSLEQDGELSELIVVAPPRTIAELRNSFSSGVKAKVIEEIHKDLTNRPIYEIEALLTGR